jgi:hypothetical protein
MGILTGQRAGRASADRCRRFCEESLDDPNVTAHTAGPGVVDATPLRHAGGLVVRADLDRDAMTEPLPRSGAVELKYTLDRKDLTHMIRTLYRSGRAGWVFGPVGAVVIGGCALLYVAGSVMTGRLGGFGYFGWLGVVVPVVVLLMPEWIALASMRMSRDANRTFRATVDDSGLRTAGPHAEMVTGWQQYHGFRETEHYFELPLARTLGRQLLLLPKRALSEADVQQLRAKLSSHLTDLSRN